MTPAETQEQILEQLKFIGKQLIEANRQLAQLTRQAPPKQPL